MKQLLTLLVVVVLAGCATSPPPLQSQKAAPANQVATLPAVTSPKPATIRIVRDEGFIGVALYIHVSLDGNKVVSLNAGEFQEFQVDPGEYLLSAILTDPFNARHPTTVDANWRAGGRYSYRTGVDGNAVVTLFRVP